MQTRDFLDRLHECRSALFDVDNTSVDGNVSAGIGKRYLQKEMMAGHCGNFMVGVIGGLGTTIYRKAMKDDENGIGIFIKSLNMARCVDEETTKKFAREYVSKHSMPGAKDFVDHLRRMNIYSIVHTGGMNLSAEVVKEELGFDDSFGNYCLECDVIVPTRYADIKPNKTSTAMRYLEHAGRRIGDCLVVGDAESDLELMDAARLSLASPKASKRVRKAASLWVPDYTDLF